MYDLLMYFVLKFVQIPIAPERCGKNMGGDPVDIPARTCYFEIGIRLVPVSSLPETHLQAAPGKLRAEHPDYLPRLQNILDYIHQPEPTEAR